MRTLDLGTAPIISPTEMRGFVECALYGDSRLAGTHSGVNEYAYIIENAVSPAGWITFNTRGRVVFPQDLNFAVGGDTTTLMLARLDAVAACRAKHVLILGGINDRGGAALTADTSITNMNTMLNKLYQAGKIVHLIAELPRGDAANTGNRISSPQLDYHARFRTWMLYVVPKLYPNVIVYNCYPTTAIYSSTTGDAIAGIHHDGLHPATAGAKIIAQPVAAWFNANLPEPMILPSSLSEQVSAYHPHGWRNSNPTMNTTGGSVGTGFTGNIAANWVATRNSAAAAGTLTLTLAKVARTNGEWQQVTITGNTASNSAPEITIYQDILSTLTAGEILEAIGECEWDGSVAGVVGVYLSVRTENPTVYESKALDARDTNNPMLAAADSGVQVVQKHIVPPNTSVARLRWSIRLAESFTGVNIVARFGNTGHRLLDTTTSN